MKALEDALKIEEKIQDIQTAIDDEVFSEEDYTELYSDAKSIIGAALKAVKIDDIEKEIQDENTNILDIDHDNYQQKQLENDAYRTRFLELESEMQVICNWIETLIDLLIDGSSYLISQKDPKKPKNALDRESRLKIHDLILLKTYYNNLLERIKRKREAVHEKSRVISRLLTLWQEESKFIPDRQVMQPGYYQTGLPNPAQVQVPINAPQQTHAHNMQVPSGNEEINPSFPPQPNLAEGSGPAIFNWSDI